MGQMLKFREERRLDRKLVREVERRGGRALKAEVVGWKGWPDRLVLVAPAGTWFVEMKSSTGALSERQKYTRLWMLGRGYKHRVIKTDGDLDAFLKEVDQFIGKNR